MGNCIAQNGATIEADHMNDNNHKRKKVESIIVSIIKIRLLVHFFDIHGAKCIITFHIELNIPATNANIIKLLIPERRKYSLGLPTNMIRKKLTTI